MHIENLGEMQLRHEDSIFLSSSLLALYSGHIVYFMHRNPLSKNIRYKVM